MSDNIAFSMMKGMAGNLFKSIKIPPWELIVSALIMLVGVFVMVFGFAGMGNIKYAPLPDDPTEGFAEIEDEVVHPQRAFSSLPKFGGIDLGSMARSYVGGKKKSYEREVSKK